MQIHPQHYNLYDVHNYYVISIKIRVFFHVNIIVMRTILFMMQKTGF